MNSYMATLNSGYKLFHILSFFLNFCLNNQDTFGFLAISLRKNKTTNEQLKSWVNY